MSVSIAAPFAAEQVTFLDAILRAFESKNDFDEWELAGEIDRQIKRNATEDSGLIGRARMESMAFAFSAGQGDRWKTYFGPYISAGDHCNPDIRKVSAETIGYWITRASAVRHPVMRARYADLVWDLSKPAAAIPKPIEMCRTAIDSYIDAAALSDGSTFHVSEERLERALVLAIVTKDVARTKGVIAAMFALVRRFPGDREWVWLYDTLRAQDSRLLDSSQAQTLIDELERVLQAGADNEFGGGANEGMEVAMRLATYYQSQGDDAAAKRVILKAGRTVARLSKVANGLVSQAWLSSLYEQYKQYGLRDDADRVLVALKEKGAEAEAQIVPITSTAELDAKEVGAYLDAMTDGGLELSLKRLIVHFTPKLDEIRKHAAERREAFPLQGMFTRVIVGDSQIVSRVEPDDDEGQLICDIAEHIGFNSFFLAHVIDRMRERYSVTTASLVEYIRLSPLFDDSDIVLLDAALGALLEGDYLKAIHLIVPRIEHGLRVLLFQLGEPTSKSRREHTTWMVEKSLNDLLEREEKIVKVLGENAVFYLRAFLVDPRGPNLRNRLSHGLLKPSEFERRNADVLLHIVLLLGSLRLKHSPSAGSQGQDGVAETGAEGAR